VVQKLHLKKQQLGKNLQKTVQSGWLKNYTAFENSGCVKTYTNCPKTGWRKVLKNTKWVKITKTVRFTATQVRRSMYLVYIFYLYSRKNGCIYSGSLTRTQIAVTSRDKQHFHVTSRDKQHFHVTSRDKQHFHVTSRDKQPIDRIASNFERMSLNECSVNRSLLSG
jgi:hypothetical protein